MSQNPKYEFGQIVPITYQGHIVDAAYLEWSEKYNLAIVEYNGKRLYRNIKGEPRGRSGSASSEVEIKPSRFSIGQRFSFIEEVCSMVIEGESNSVIISGSGGLGKTFTVMQALKKANLVDVSTGRSDEDKEEHEYSEGREEGDYEVVKGFTTPKAMYRLLWENRNRLIVFDDCDSVWDNPTSVSLLKAALDSYETRSLSWLSEGRRGDDDDELPQQFEFKGKIIFVSNLTLGELDQAVLSRCLYVDVSMTPAEKIERIRSLVPAIRPEMSLTWKNEVVDALSEFAESIGDLNIRTFLKGCEIRHRNAKNWRELLEYVITAL